MYSTFFFILAGLAPKLCTAAVHVPIAISTVKHLGFSTDPASNPDINHDGGGGASQNGYHVQVFADSQVGTGGKNFVHNSISYFGYRESHNPVVGYTFGMSGTGDDLKFASTPMKAMMDNETALGGNFAIWSYNGFTPMPDGKTIVGVQPALNEGTGEDLYSTMVQIEVVDPSEIEAGGYPPTTRLGTGMLFFPDELQFGSFGMIANPDGYMYLFASDDTGIKISKTPMTNNSIADRNDYVYWNNATAKWQSEILTKNNASQNIITWSWDYNGKTMHPAQGDIFYDAYHKTTLMVFGDSFVSGTVWVSYSEKNDLKGRWSKPVQVYAPALPSECADLTPSVNYCTHAHPGYDASGKTLLVSWSSCSNYVSFAKIFWK